MRALTELKKECMSRIVGGRPIQCAICKENKPKRLLLHHYSYNNESVTYNQFENSDDGRLKYYSNMMDDVKKNPFNFEIFCVNCHNEVESQVSKTLKGEEIQYSTYDHPTVFWTAVFVTTQCRFHKKTSIDSEEDYFESVELFNQAHKPDTITSPPSSILTMPCVLCNELSTTKKIIFFKNKNIGRNIIPLCASHEEINIVDVGGPIPGEFGDMHVITASTVKDPDCLLEFPLFPNGLAFD